MATKQEELSNPQSAWNLAAPDEPVLVLRGTHLMTPFMTRQFARHYLLLNSHPINVGTELRPKLQYQPNSQEVREVHDELMTLAAKMDAYPRKTLT
jgi:hypothetical protein